MHMLLIKQIFYIQMVSIHNDIDQDGGCFSLGSELVKITAVYFLVNLSKLHILCQQSCLKLDITISNRIALLS